MNSAEIITNACVSFRLNDRSPEKKSDTFEVWRLRDAIHLGQVRWHSRKYCFFPTGGVAFDADCLQSIGRFVEYETEKHRKGKRAFLS